MPERPCRADDHGCREHVVVSLQRVLCVAAPAGLLDQAGGETRHEEAECSEMEPRPVTRPAEPADEVRQDRQGGDGQPPPCRDPPRIPNALPEVALHGATVAVHQQGSDQHRTHSAGRPEQGDHWTTPGLARGGGRPPERPGPAEGAEEEQPRSPSAAGGASGSSGPHRSRGRRHAAIQDAVLVSGPGSVPSTTGRGARLSRAATVRRHVPVIRASEARPSRKKGMSGT